ncbi:IS1595 family transposase [Sphingomonas psychrotolerans]|uniref:IS1595 family transposase n=1 Tax=Sphingomonas psychrotolerans TaxID=1327635 RepID=A0ABU3N0W4_9SPHN|nr:IS1595 family transposase [Sphingomonas psychrotolerans]MDT8758194.1 IS1595 family transposase [Sphingomonas psychrotolerans]
MSVLSKAYFHDEEAAFAYLESKLWPEGPVCVHCGGVERITKVKANPAKRIRAGLWRCGQCKSQFTVKVGTVFEHARMPLHKMLQAVYLMTSSKKGVSAHQLHRMLEVTYKTAWFLAHRIREAMRDGDLSPFGAGGGMVEVDETYIGRKKGADYKGGGGSHKMKVLGLIDRETGRSRAMVIDSTTRAAIEPIVMANLAKEARLMTDEALLYRKIGVNFADHQVVRHYGNEYVRGEAHTNTVEGYFSIFKRGMRGVYQHCGEQHLHRYVAEFNFRYNFRAANGFNDGDRSEQALKGIVGKRLTYARPDLNA